MRGGSGPGVSGSVLEPAPPTTWPCPFGKPSDPPQARPYAEWASVWGEDGMSPALAFCMVFTEAQSRDWWVDSSQNSFPRATARLKRGASQLPALVTVLPVRASRHTFSICFMRTQK